MTLFAKFLNNESGAVTVDWVVLTAAIVGIALAIIAVIRTSLNSAAGDIATAITDAMTST